MYVSVVICTHSQSNYPELADAIDSLVKQTYQNREIIVVVDGDRELYNRLVADHWDKRMVRATLLNENKGVSEARNTGIKLAGGDVIAFLDDDAIAAKDWIEYLVDTYKTLGALAVGGRILPVWKTGVPDYLPEELYWLIGATYNGFAEDKVSEVRNSFGPNMSFRREVFEKVGTFNKNFGFASKSKVYLQAEEPEMALRMRKAFGKGVMYNPRAVVYHKVPAAKLRVGVLLRRAFYQGYSKALLRKLTESKTSISVEKTYLKTLLFQFIPGRMKRFYQPAESKKAAMMLATVISVGLGFAYAGLREYLAHAFPD